MRAPLRLRVATFNIHGARPRVGLADVEATARVIQDLEADLVALQEVHRWLPPPYVFQDQPRRFRKLLGRPVLFRRSFGVGPVGYGNAVIAPVKPDRVRRIRLPGGLEPRSMLEVDFTLHGRRIRLFNAHLGLDARQRENQIRRVAARVARSPLPVIVAGDWNTLPDSPEMEPLRAIHLEDCAGTDTPTFPCDDPKCRLDYLMVGRGFRVDQCWAVPTTVSDHLPLVADVVLE